MSISLRENILAGAADAATDLFDRDDPEIRIDAQALRDAIKAGNITYDEIAASFIVSFKANLGA